MGPAVWVMVGLAVLIGTASWVVSRILRALEGGA